MHRGEQVDHIPYFVVIFYTTTMYILIYNSGMVVKWERCSNVGCQLSMFMVNELLKRRLGEINKLSITSDINIKHNYYFAINIFV